MSDIAYRYENVAYVKGRTDWGAIWGGMFTFIAIWSVFGLLGVALFTGAADPDVASPATAMGVGMGIWGIALTVIAMYVAGMETGRLSGVTDRHDALVHGIVMFGLSVVAAAVITVMVGAGLPGAFAPGAISPYMLFVGAGWIGFLSLFLGLLAATVGAALGAKQKPPAEIREARRPAA